MQYSRVLKKQCFIIGVSIRTTNKDGQAFQDIPLFWQRVQENNLLDLVPDVLDQQKIYALYTDYHADGSYAMIIGKRVHCVKTIPEGMVSCVIPAGDYALFTARGIEFGEAVGELWTVIWQEPLQRAFTTDFEVYDARLLSKPIPEVPIFVAIKAE